MAKEWNADVIIIGASTGGCAAALSAARLGYSVVMTEESDWIGGQLTSQAVPPDEHPWIEQFGCTASYRQFRQRVRDYYRQNFSLTSTAYRNPYLNPGNAIVSRIAHEPRTALRAIQDMLAPYIHSGKLKIVTESIPVSAEVTGDKIDSVTIQHTPSNQTYVLTGRYILDATETGELLPLANVEFRVGAESQKETGEPHALEEADPMNMQSFTHCFAMDYVEGEDFTIDKPEQYSFWKTYKADFWPDHLLSWTGVNPRTLEPVEYQLFAEEDQFSLWNYRRIIDTSLFDDAVFQSDITLVNWQQIGYWLGSIINVSEEEKQTHLHAAKQLSLSFLYWMQTEAPRPDGKIGYPGLRLRSDVTGTIDGLAKKPYIRESRRIQALFTVLEQHVSAIGRENEQIAPPFRDSVGVGCYRIDLHPSTQGRNYVDIPSLPFQIPLGSLIPVRMENLLPACKNIGTTHITNGCYRLHPVEWNIGEASGALAAYCLQNDLTPKAVYRSATHTLRFQNMLTSLGVEIAWPQLRRV